VTGAEMRVAETLRPRQLRQLPPFPMPREEFTREAHLEDGDPRILLYSMLRLFRLLPAAQKQEFLQQVAEAA